MSEKSEMKASFSYHPDDITERDKQVVEEVISLLEQRSDIPTPMVIAELKTKFNLEEVPMMKLEESVWGQLTKDEKLGQSMQGYKETTDKEGNKIRIPHIGFSADLDDLDIIIQRVAKKVIELTKE